LADEDKSVIDFSVYGGLKKFMGKEYDGIHRTTFVIDENGVIDEVEKSKLSPCRPDSKSYEVIILLNKKTKSKFYFLGF
jgi:peroxiredoxin